MARSFQSIALPTSVSALSPLAWSENSELAIATNKGVLIHEVIPNPRNLSPEINLQKSLLNRKEASNPVISELLDELRVNAAAPDKSSFQKPFPILKSENAGHANVVQWAPKGMIRPHSCCLVTLSEDHWLRLYEKEGQEVWKENIDFTQIVFDNLNQGNNWKEVKISRKLDMRAKIDFMSFTSFVWTESFQLITSNHLGFLTVLQVTQKESSEFKVVKILDAGVGSISTLFYQENILYVGSFEGRIKLFKVNAKNEIKDVGFVSEIVDMISVKKIVEIPSKNNQRRVVSIKGKFLVVCDFEVEARKVKVSSQTARPVGMSNIVNFLPGISEHSFLVSSENDHPKVLTFVDSGTDWNLGDVPIKELELTNNKIVGCDVSNNRAFYVFIENLVNSHDHLVLRRPATLLFITFHSPENLEDVISGVGGNFKVSNQKDTLEMYRLLSLGDEVIHCSLIRFIGKLKLDEQVKLKIWILSLLEQSRDLMSTELHFLIRKVLCDHAMSILERDSRNLSDEHSALKSYVQKNTKSVDVLSKVNNMISIPNYNWKCRLCAQKIALDGDTFVKCKAGHEWPLCVSTLKVCDSPSVRQCPICNSFSLNNECILCDIIF